jgi:hypothetical protein
MNSKGIRVGIEIETRENRNKFSSWVTPFLLNINFFYGFTNPKDFFLVEFIN